MRKLASFLASACVSTLAASASAEVLPTWSNFGIPYQFNLETKAPDGEKAAKETIPLWGFTFNCIPACHSTANELKFRFQETGNPGEFVVKMMGGVYYSLVKNDPPARNDVVLVLELLDIQGYVIARTDMAFTRDNCSADTTFKINLPPDKKALSGNPTAFPRPIRDATSVRITPNWVQRGPGKCPSVR